MLRLRRDRGGVKTTATQLRCIIKGRTSKIFNQKKESGGGLVRGWQKISLLQNIDEALWMDGTAMRTPSAGEHSALERFQPNFRMRNKYH